MILELFGIYAAYKAANKYNRNWEEVNRLKSRLKDLEENADDYEYRSLRKEIREINEKLDKLSHL